MRKTRPWLYIFLPVLYLSVIFGLVVLQFSKKSDTFSQSLGDMTVSGKTSEGGGPIDLALHGRGLEFTFNAAKTLTLVAADGTVAKVRPTQWSWKDGNLVVQFQQGIVLTFLKSGPGGSILLLQPTLPPAVAAKTVALRLPFAGEGGGRVDIQPSRPVVVISRGTQKFLATLDGASDRIESDNTFVLTLRADKARPVRLEALPEGADPIRQWLVQSLGPTTVADAKEAVKAYIDAAWKAWGDGRFKPSQGGWMTSDGSVRFSSRLVAAWAQEALARGSYASVMGRVQALLADSPATWNFDALPYLGNLMEVTQAQRRAVEAATSRGTIEWSGQPRLYLDAVAYGPEGSAARLQKLLVSADLPSKTPDLLSILANLTTLPEGEAAVTARVAQVVGQLVARVVRQDGDLFVLTPEGYRDLKSGLLLGRLLLDQTSNLQSDQWQAIGSQLILSALRFQDGLTRIPEVLIVAPGQLDQAEGAFYPEEVYSILVGGGATATALGPGGPVGTFVHSARPPVAKSVSASTIRLTFQFPVGSSESLLIAGLPPFESIMLHGIRWRTDPQFQSYTDGWYYSASTKTLYVKIKHREEQEELVINLQPPKP